MAEAKSGDSLAVFRRTGIYAEIGGPGSIHVSGNLEHYFINGQWTHVGIRAGYGKWESWGGGGSEVITTASGQVGKRHHFAELQVGSLVYTELDKSNGPNDQPSDVVQFMVVPFVSTGYVFRWKHLQWKANVNSRLTINAAVGLVF
jgi:hypothetical protein